MSHLRYLWPTLTPCPKCGGKAWWAVKTQGPANQRKCRACGTWFRVEATHEEVENPGGASSAIRAIQPGAKPAVKGK